MDNIHSPVRAKSAKHNTLVTGSDQNENVVYMTKTSQFYHFLQFSHFLPVIELWCLLAPSHTSKYQTDIV